MVSKRKFKGGSSIFGLALVAVLAFSAVAAAGASANVAPRWKLNGTYIGAGGTKAYTSTSTAEVSLSGGGVKFLSPKGECSTAGEIEGSAAGNPGKTKNDVLTCKKVTISGAPTCTVKSPGAEAGTVVTNTLKGTLVWLNETGGAAGVLYEPASGTLVTEIEITGCALASKIAVTNTVLASFTPVEEEVTVSTLTLPSSPILNYWNNETPRVKQTVTRLKLGANNATLSGTLNFKLNSGEKLGVSPPLPSPTEPRWQVTEGGSTFFLSGGSTRAFSLKSTGTMNWATGGVSGTISECTMTGNIAGSASKTPGTVTEAKLSCSGAVVTGVGSCNVHSPGQAKGVIVTNNLKGTLVRQSKNAFGGPMSVLLEQEGENWFNLEITECAASLLSGPVKGQLSVAIDAGEAKTHTFTLPVERPTNYWNYAASQKKCEEEKGVYDGENTGLCERTISQLKIGANFYTLNGGLAGELLTGVSWGVALG